MKVLIARNADTSNFGGAETFVMQLATQLVKNDVEAVVATAMPILTEKLQKENIEVIKSPWLAWQNWHGIYTHLVFTLHFPWMIYMTLWYWLTIKKLKPDILHPMNRDDFIAATVAGKLTGTPVIWTDHADLKHELAGVHQPLKNFLGKAVLFWAKRASAITVVSNNEKNMILNEAGDELADKIQVVYNGAISSPVSPASKPANTIVLGVTARIRHQKGLRELIDAFKILVAPSGKKLELWLIGDGPNLADLKERAGKDHRIKFLGFKENWLDYVAAMDIFVLPTYTEGFSLSLVEAAMLEKPIVTTAVGGNPEIIIDGKTGLLVPIKEVEPLATAMQKLLDDPKLAKQLASNAHQKWEDEFQFDRLVKTRFIEIYKHNIE